jgi:DNA-binding LacI/PurR family transcriptional regulator
MRENEPVGVNVKDVAARAGVSPRTVSNVANGYVHVSARTRARVQRAIEELNYRPNISARRLRQGRTGIIALAVPELAAPYFAELADLVQRRAAERGVTVLVDQTGGLREQELLVLEGFRTHVIDGLLFSPMALTAQDLEDHSFDTPTVLLGERISGGGRLHVSIDNVAAARTATQHLIDGGRRRIAAVGADVPADNITAALRLRGYREAITDAGLATKNEMVIPTAGFGRTAGHAAVRAALSEGIDLDGLFCFNDTLAIGAINALADVGLTVPGDVAVVGIDNIEEGRFCTPSLTTIAPDKPTIARTAVDGLLAQIQDGHADQQELTCDYELIIRESSTKLRRRPRGRARR